MGTKTAEWRPGPSVCRCCLAEGCYKDISTEYFWMGKREVYAEMLKDTFDLTVAYSKSKGPNSHSRLICEQCIARLRDASAFKRQVRECERTFLQQLDPASTSGMQLEVTVEPFSKPVKIEDGGAVKEEALASDFDDADDLPDFGDDDDDDLDDQPLMALASKVPKKETVDITDLLDNAKATAKRKSSAKGKPPPAKKSKVIKQKVERPKQQQQEKKKKGQSSQSVAKRNAKIIVAHTTAYPFRQPSESNLMCVYCFESYTDPAEFRKHMKEKHVKFQLQYAFMHVMNSFLKVDLTEFRCRICNQSLEGLNDAAKHLNDKHYKDTREKINFNHPIGLQPYKFCGTKISCVICDKHFPNIRLLSRHMATHYLSQTCEECGKSYASKDALQHHIRFSHVPGKHICRRCREGFSTIEERRVHIESTENCWPYNCYECCKRFLRYNDKLKHQTEVHGQEKKDIQCLECSQVFASSKLLGCHFKKEHGGGFVCSYCGRDYASSKSLSRHIVGIHKKEKN